MEIGDDTRTTIGFVWKVAGSITAALLLLVAVWNQINDRIVQLERDGDRAVDRIHNLEEHVQWQPPHHAP